MLFSLINWISISKERDTYKENLERMNSKIGLKSQELSQKIREVDSLKQKYEFALGKMEMRANTEVVTKKSTYTTKKFSTKNSHHSNQFDMDKI